ncbi:MAG: hypothetical protein SFX73_02905 [Kofleriaceae bacterium]|nr:hypothetical protein [Kofleriaceae bacterium]
MRFAIFAVACLGSGCAFIFDGDDDGDDVCALTENTEPAIAPAPQRDPGTLLCQSIGGGCNPDCGPCPAVAAVTPLAPIPSWPICGHACEGKAEAACETDPQCRVVKNAECTFGAVDCLTDYIGCFPVDTVVDGSIDCRGADAWDCSRSSNCTAYHSYEACGTDAECPRPFELCMTEGQSPGECYLPVTCRALPPACGANETPGIEAGCYTGACIPQHLCAPNR